MPPATLLPGSAIVSEKHRLEPQYAPPSEVDPQLSRAMSQPDQLHQALATRLGPFPAGGAQNEKRQLPSREVRDETFDEAYVSFIMYCNPSVPFHTGVEELKRTFRSPPKSDGKNFSPFVLFELIRRLEAKELKTWAQLALELGVEPPALEKGQSAQKVQQYAVRLKRWLHAMHVDAFFEYLLGKDHIYWTKLPSPQESLSDSNRDGVPAEEDLALRSLLPEFRPKRGRRKAEDRDRSDHGISPAQRPRLDSPTLSEDFAMVRTSILSDNEAPATAHPDFQQVFHDRIVPWSATDTAGPPSTTFRWPPPDGNPTYSAYPQSAITPTNRTQLWNDEPRSAITPKSRVRRRHGPAVSSAWPSSNGTNSGRLRGRPPSNRSVTDGPFSTFPANPSPKDIQTGSISEDVSSATPVISNANSQHFFPSIAEEPSTIPTSQNGRPSRLSLQVPQRQGGAVRLATPPPVVLLNGEGDTMMNGAHAENPQYVTPLLEYFSCPGNDPNLQQFVSVAFSQNEDTDRTNMDALESHFICEILAAEWYDAAGVSIEKCSIDEADKICKQVIKNLQAESSSREAFLINLSALAGGPLMTRLKMTKLEQGTVSHYKCHWKMRFGAIEGNFTIRAAVHHGIDSAPIEHGPEIPEESWKKRYLDLQQQIRERDEKVGKLKRNILDALVVSNQFSSI